MAAEEGAGKRADGTEPGRLRGGRGAEAQPAAAASGEVEETQRRARAPAPAWLRAHRRGVGMGWA